MAQGQMPGYQGSVTEIPFGSGGLMSDVTPSLIPPTHLIRATNIDYGAGYAQKAPGSLKYNANTLGSGIVAGIDYWPNPGQQRLLVATANGRIYRDVGDKTFTSNAAIYTSANVVFDATAQFISAGAEVGGSAKKLFFLSGKEQMKVLLGDASTFASITLPASDWTSPNFPKKALVHKNSLWAFAKERAYKSTTGDHSNFTGSGNLAMTVGPGDGGDIIDATIFKGRMLVMKEDEVVYYLVDSDADSDNWYFSRLGTGFTAASTHSLLEVIDDLIMGNNYAGLTSFQAVQSFGDVKQGDILANQQVSNFFREHIVPSGASVMHSLYYSDKKCAFFTARTKYGQSNNALIYIDVAKPGQPRFAYWDKDAADCLFLRKDVNKVRRPAYGSADGFVYLMDREDRLVGGAAFRGELQTPHLDLRHLDPTVAHKDKLFERIWITYLPEGAHNLSIDVYIDERFSQTVTVPMTNGTNYMGSFVLGSSPLGTEAEQTSLGVPIKGTGKRISFRCYNEGSLQSFRICKLLLGFRIAGENPTRIT